MRIKWCGKFLFLFHPIIKLSDGLYVYFYYEATSAFRTKIKEARSNDRKKTIQILFPLSNLALYDASRRNRVLGISPDNLDLKSVMRNGYDQDRVRRKREIR